MRTILFSVMLCATTVASAQAPDAGVATSQAAEARALFEQGVALSEQERWGEALEYFRRSRALVDRPSTAFNIAVALLRLGRPTEALTALRDYLQMPGEDDEARRAEARQQLELALSSVAELTLLVDPPHAEVRIDGNLVAGDTARRTISLDPGSHRAQVTAEDHLPQSFELSVLTGERVERTVRLEPDLVPRGPARVTVTSTVAAARIRIDGAEVGQGTWSGELEPGSHRLEVTANEHEAFRRTLTVDPAERLDVQAALRPIPEPSVLEQPWLWIAAGVLVVGAGIGVGIALGSGEDDPYPGTTGVVLQGLR